MQPTGKIKLGDTIKYEDPYGDICRGLVEQVDTHRMKIKIDGNWVPLNCIKAAYDTAEALASKHQVRLVEPEWPDYVAPSPFKHLLAKPTESPTKSLKECECGAKHTSFPNSHMSFCPMRE